MGTVLLIDDGRPLADPAFAGRLEAAGFEPTFATARTVDEAVAAVDACRPHVAILGALWQTPDRLVEAVRAIRAAAGLPGLSILLAASARDGDRDPGETEGLIQGIRRGGADDTLAFDEPMPIVEARLRRLILARRLAAVAALNEQLAQVGRLVAGVVHEIRGPLAVVRGNVELMGLELDDDHPAASRVRPAIRGIVGLQGRLDHLMSAVRPRPCEPRPVDVAPLLAESINLFEKGVDHCRGRVDVALHAPLAIDGEPVPGVVVDPGRLIQVVLNLLSNALDAIVEHQEAGRIDVRIGLDRDEEGRPEVRVDVEDDGPGVPPRFLARVLEPFFTTKPTGTGYGLYLAAEILREHGGRLAVANRPEPDRGARFSIHLPAGGDPPADQGATNSRESCETAQVRPG